MQKKDRGPLRYIRGFAIWLIVGVALEAMLFGLSRVVPGAMPFFLAFTLFPTVWILVGIIALFVALLGPRPRSPQ